MAIQFYLDHCSGQICGSCETGTCSVDESMPCSPDCSALLPDGTRVPALCDGCDANPDMDE